LVTIIHISYNLLIFTCSIDCCLLCVEEPENQLYPHLLAELAEEFRAYANRGEQVFVSTHSPDFLNAINVEEVFLLVKEKGYTTINRASEDKQIVAYMNDGDQMGYLWKQGFFVTLGKK
jgi:predicted ATPase